jgi:hypothetical protein
MATIEFTISGSAQGNARIGSLNVDRVLNQRDRCSVQFDDPAGSWSPSAGLDLGVFIDGTRVFGGIIASVERDRSPRAAWRRNKIEAAGYEWLCDRRIVGNAATPTVAYVGAKANDIVRDLISTWCVSDGIDITTVTAGAGPTIDSIEFTLATVSDALNQVCAIAKRKWFIDVDKKIRFVDPTSGSSLYTISTSSNNALEGTVSVTEDLTQYANRVILRLPNALTDVQTESFDGSHGTQPTDGARRDWEMVYPLATEPVVTVDSVSKTVGIRGVDTGKNWYWQDGSATISQEPTDTVLPNTSTLEVNYTGRKAVFVQADNSTQQTTRAAAELNSGIYTLLFENSSSISVADAEQLAAAILDQVDEASFVLTLQSLDIPLAIPGARLTFDAIGLSSEVFTVRSLNITTSGNTPYYRIEAAKGPILKDGFEAFSSFSGGGANSASVTASGGGGGSSTDVFFGVNPVTASVTPDWANGAAQKIDLVSAGGATTINAPSGAADGLEVTIMLIPRTYGITWNAAWKMPDWAVVDPTASTYTLARWKYDGSTLRLTSFLTGVPL